MAVPKHQMSLALITHVVKDTPISQRSDDGYINASALCEAANKRWYQYQREEATGHFLRALSAKTGLPLNELIQEIGPDIEGNTSTWVHPKVAIHLATWLSAEFAVQVSEWVYDWLNGKGDPRPAGRSGGALPYHINRHMLNVSSVPAGHFSVLQEMTFMLIAPLDQAGYELPETMVPDISMGRFLCAHLRDQLGVDTDSLPVYMHRYPDGRTVEAKIYPNEYLADFRRIIQEEWLPQRSAKYFSERDPVALPFLDKVILALPGPKTAANAPRFKPKLKKKSK